MTAPTNPDSEEKTPSPAPSATRLRWVGRGVQVLAGLVLFGLGWALAPHAEPSGAATHAQADWTCAMHPEIRLPSPGPCPICAMDLVQADGSEALRPDRIELSERARVLARLRTEAVTAATSGAGLRLLGRVDYDETTLATVTSWVGGRLDRLHVRTTGATLRRGQRVASVYSPEVHAAANDLRVAQRQLERLADATPLAQTAARRTLEAAQSRLSLLGVPDGEVERMRHADRPPARIAVRSPFSGTVVERLVAEGETLAPGAGLVRVANLRRLWVQLDAYEADLLHVSVGQPVRLIIDALGAETFEGRVAFVDPVLDPVRRTARVRVEVDNQEGRLRPGMDARAELAPNAEGVVPSIPVSAPLFTGTRSLVYVEVPDAEQPTYEAREVRLGARAGDRYPVIAGLVAGERIVVHGAFVLDADQQLSGRASMMNGQLDALSEDAAAVPEDFRVGLRPAVEAVLRMASHLAADDFEGARQDCAALVEALDGFTPTEPADAAASYRPLADALRAHAARAQTAESIEVLRVGLEPIVADTSALLARFGNPLAQPIRVAHCPMAFDGRGATWLQRGERIDNAYFGAAMRTCGSIRQTVRAGAHLREVAR
ncbi:MAG: efflux RND transporter periplasmic adaptor subunit [Sandaracinaceae bacterium]